jgi:hypothetical protein
MRSAVSKMKNVKRRTARASPLRVHATECLQNKAQNVPFTSTGWTPDKSCRSFVIVRYECRRTFTECCHAAMSSSSERGLLNSAARQRQLTGALTHDGLCSCDMRVKAVLVCSFKYGYSIALGYRLDDQGSRVRFPTGAGNFSLHHRLQTSLLSNGYQGLLPWG